jgi:hypothetical protein
MVEAAVLADPHERPALLIERNHLINLLRGWMTTLPWYTSLVEDLKHCTLAKLVLPHESSAWSAALIVSNQLSGQVSAETSAGTMDSWGGDRYRAFGVVLAQIGQITQFRVSL